MKLTVSSSIEELHNEIYINIFYTIFVLSDEFERFVGFMMALFLSTWMTSVAFVFCMYITFV